MCEDFSEPKVDHVHFEVGLACPASLSSSLGCVSCPLAVYLYLFIPSYYYLGNNWWERLHGQGSAANREGDIRNNYL